MGVYLHFLPTTTSRTNTSPFTLSITVACIISTKFTSVGVMTSATHNWIVVLKKKEWLLGFFGLYIVLILSFIYSRNLKTLRYTCFHFAKMLLWSRVINWSTSMKDTMLLQTVFSTKHRSSVATMVEWATVILNATNAISWTMKIAVWISQLIIWWAGFISKDMMLSLKFSCNWNSSLVWIGVYTLWTVSFSLISIRPSSETDWYGCVFPQFTFSFFFE